MDEPRWLDDEQLQVWLDVVTVLVNLPPALDDALATHGMNFFEYSVLAALSDAPDATMSMGSLAELSHSSPSRLSHATRRLCGRGWVRRARSCEDRRVTFVSLTDEGRQVMARAAPDHVASVRAAVFDAMDDATARDLGRGCAAIAAVVAPDMAIRELARSGRATAQDITDGTPTG